MMATTTTYTDEARQVLGNFVIRAGKTFVVIRCSDVFEEERVLRVTLDDVAVFSAGRRATIRVAGPWPVLPETGDL